MLYQRKVDRAMEWLKNKNKTQNNKYSDKEKWEYESGDMKLGKKDIVAIIISALLVFGPIILALIGIIILVFR